MNHRILRVEPGSLAARLGLKAGDRLAQIDGQNVIDLIDYQALSCASKLRLTVDRAGKRTEYSIEKDDYEPLGLEFGGQLMSGVRSCCNRCVFCFVDQLPSNSRQTMRVKDDDWRLSLMMGNFVTLTNVGPRELDRIIARRASPLYISVHATEPSLRARMLGTPRGAAILEQLKRLANGGIRFHLQAVLCPGYNDGDALDRTLSELAALRPAALSLALVPVGLTSHRLGLTELKPFDAVGASRVLDQVDAWRARLAGETGSGFVQAADEFYILAGRPLPEEDAYEGYPQIENGVGMCRLLEREFDEAYRMDDLEAQPAKISVACGVSVQPFLEKLIRDHPLPGVEARVIPVENGFFGPTVTVSGLLTGRDLIRGLQGITADRVLITECMLRENDPVFLALTEVERALNLNILPVGRRGDQLLDALKGAMGGIHG
jgi:putative radical SAM enzyme (TIGR03279 family)